MVRYLRELNGTPLSIFYKSLSVCVGVFVHLLTARGKQTKAIHGNPPTHLPTHPPTCPFTHPSIHLSTHLPTNLSTPTYSFTYPPTHALAYPLHSDLFKISWPYCLPNPSISNLFSKCLFQTSYQAALSCGLVSPWPGVLTLMESSLPGTLVRPMHAHALTSGPYSFLLP